MTNSLQEKILNHNNDYSIFLNKYEKKWQSNPTIDPYKAYQTRIPSGSPGAPEFSIVIPTYNDKKSLMACIFAITNSTFCEHFYKKIEVIIVDDGSSDPVIDWLSLDECKVKIIVLRQENFGRPQAINLGISYATKQYLVVCDADIIMHPATIEELAKLFIVDKKILIAGFRSDIDFSENNLQDKKYIWQVINTLPDFWKDNRFSFDHSEVWPENFYSLTNGFKKLGNGKKIWTPSPDRLINNLWTLERCVYGFLYAAERNLFSAIGGCNEDFRGWGWDDTEIAAQAIGQGYKIIPSPSVFGYHVYHEDRSENKWKEALANYYVLQDALQSSVRQNFLDAVDGRLKNQKIFDIANDKNNSTLLTFNPKELKSKVHPFEYFFYLGNYDAVIILLTNKKTGLEDLELSILLNCCLCKNLPNKCVLNFDIYDGKNRNLFFIDYLASLCLLGEMKKAKQYFELHKNTNTFYDSSEYLSRALLNLKQKSFLLCLKDISLFYFLNEKSFYFEYIFEEVRNGLISNEIF